jgi:PQ loop repeat
VSGLHVQNKSTGQLSIITTAANLLGALARIFTTIHEGGSAAMVRGYMLGATMSTILISQILYYGRKPGKPDAKVKNKIKAK